MILTIVYSTVGGLWEVGKQSISNYGLTLVRTLSLMDLSGAEYTYLFILLEINSRIA